jgi:large subunit ribosomal protein L35
MPKLKSSKAARKRFKVTASGKMLCRMGGKSHLLTGKSGKRRRQLRRTKQLNPLASKKILQLL